MDAKQVVSALAAIGHDHRLAVYRMLVERGPQGIAAGEPLIPDLPPPANAGLVTPRRVSRHLIYAADFAAMDALVSYLTENCCEGEACAPVCNPASVTTVKAHKPRRSA
jgi:ArsR family transcriptional regulator